MRMSAVLATGLTVRLRLSDRGGRSARRPSSRYAVRATAKRLRSVGADVVGLVLNNIPRSGDTAYQYYADDLAA